jgi:glycosyltransferase involved in cell wall biosynthesis
MDKIKITFFLPNLEIGGAEKSIVKLANALDKDKFNVSLLLCESKGIVFDILSDKIFVVDLKTSHIGLSLFKVVNYLKKNKPDIMVSALDHVNIINICASLFCRSRPKIIITERTTFSKISSESTTKFSRKFITKFILPNLVRIFYKKADSIVCVSQGVANDLKNIIGNLPTIKVIYNPVIDINILGQLVNEPLNNFSNSSLPKILAVGRLTKAKDYPTMLRAFSLVLKEIPANLLVIGDGKERKKIEQLIYDLDILDNVKLLGTQKNPFKYMNKSDVFVLSSSVEGFPNVLVEAMACGTPVVSTNCQSGPNEIIQNGENGFLVPVGDEKKLAEAIIKLLKDKELRKKFSERGKKHAQYFSIDKSAKEFENLFKKIIEK